MADKRKLQGEIERCLKKVSEGVESFEDVWQKVHNASNANQKEKYEADLKKEIKKLQRLRDQIKTWIGSNDIKDKRILLENRKLIETQMERFKVVERETKTKAYSKEGLGLATKLDPREKEKMEITDFLSNAIDTLSVQVETIEGEIETIAVPSKRGKKGDREKNGKIEQLKFRVEKHRFHIQNLEKLMRLLDNETVSVSDVKKIKEDIEFYIDSSQEEDFEENDYIYDELNMDELQPAFLINPTVDGPTPSAGNAVCPSTPAATATGPSLLAAATNGNSSITAATSTIASAVASAIKSPFGKLERSPIKQSPSMDESSLSSIVSSAVSSAVTPLTPGSKRTPPVGHDSDSTEVPNGGMQTGQSSANVSPSPSPGLIASPHSKTPAGHDADVTTEVTNGGMQTDHSSTNVSPSPSPGLIASPHSKTMNSSSNASISNNTQQPHDNGIGFSMTKSVWSGGKLPISVNKTSQVNNQVQSLASSSAKALQGLGSSQNDTALRTAASVAAAASAASLTAATAVSAPSTAPTAPAAFSALSAAAPSVTSVSAVSGAGGDTLTSNLSAPSLQQPPPQQQQSAAPRETDYGASIEVTKQNLAWQRKTLQQKNLLESAFKKKILPIDSCHLRGITSLYPLGVCYVNPTLDYVQSSKMDSLAPFMDRDEDYIFFLFYYLQGTPTQLLAAKLLKQKSWRFHTKYRLWFQRLDQPKTLHDDFESGTYIYWDLETWKPLEKSDFVFEYKYLEDKEF